MQRNHLLEKIAQTICAIRKSVPVLVGIDGMDAAGKTTLAYELSPFIESLGRKVQSVSIDGFHNPREKRIERGALSPEGYFYDSFDYDYLITQFLEPLKKLNKPTNIKSAKHDWKTENAVNEKSIFVETSTVVLFEGVFLFRSELEKYWDYKIYVKIDPKVSLERGIVRDSHLLGGLESTREKYSKRYIPGQEIYHDLCHPETKANIVIINDDPQNPELVFER